MLEKPDLPDEIISTCLRDEWGLPITRLEFLPLGADRNTAVYRAVGAGEATYFVKLRRSDFSEIAVMLPKALADLGIAQIIAPLPTRAGQLWTGLDGFKLILYPFVAGHDGYEVALTDRHWIELGSALKKIHTAALPEALRRAVPVETYSAQGREIVQIFLDRVEHETFEEAVASQAAAFLRARRGEILDLVGRAGRLAQQLQVQPPEAVVCHADLHAGNILIDSGGALFIVDWDNPILAPKERDLMYAGGGQFGGLRAPQVEEALFYQGYGPAVVDPRALAYYRYERIIQDLAVECEQLFLSRAGVEDRKLELQYLKSNFAPRGVLDIARESDQTSMTMD